MENNKKKNDKPKQMEKTNDKKNDKNKKWQKQKTTRMKNKIGSDPPPIWPTLNHFLWVYFSTTSTTIITIA